MWRKWMLSLLTTGDSSEERLTAGGALLITRVPHRGSDAWHHILFPPQDCSRVIEIGQILGRRLPDPLTALYEEMNGLSLFSDSLSLYGLPTTRSRRSAEPQPYDIRTANIWERERAAPETALFIGFYANDGSHVTLDVVSGSVEVCQRGSMKSIARWSSLRQMLESEIRRLGSFYTPDGFRTDETARSAPPPEGS